MATKTTKKSEKSTKVKKETEKKAIKETKIAKNKKVDIKKQEKEPKNDKTKLKSVSKKKVAPAKVSDEQITESKKVEKTISTEKKDVLINKTIGTFSDDIVDAMMPSKSNSEIAFEKYKKLEIYKANNELIWGRLKGIEYIKLPGRTKKELCARVSFNDVKILIPEKQFFEPTYNFGKQYKTLSNEGKAKKRMKELRACIDAIVCFYIKEAYLVNAGEQFHNVTIPIAIASRTEAMYDLREHYFFDKNRDNSLVQVGAKVKARIIKTNESLACVECMGVETQINIKNISSNWVESVNDEVKVGQTKEFVITKLEIDELSKKIDLQLSGRIVSSPEAVAQMEPNSYYCGHVINYSEKSDSYTILLDIKTFASVKQEFIEGKLILIPGDRVCVHVTKIYNEENKNFATGTAVKI